MIKINYQPEDVLIQQLKEIKDNALILKICTLERSEEESYLDILQTHLGSLTHLTQLKIILKQNCILLQNRCSKLATTISQLTNLTIFSLEIQRACLVEGIELEDLFLSLQKLLQLEELQLIIQENNQITDTSVKNIFFSLKNLPSFSKLDFSFHQILYGDQDDYSTVWKDLSGFQNLKELKIGVNQSSLRNDYFLTLFDQISQISQLEHFEIVIASVDSRYLWWFDEYSKVVGSLKSLKTIILTIDIEKGEDENKAFINQNQFNKLCDIIANLQYLESVELPSNFYKTLQNTTGYNQAMKELLNLKKITVFVDSFQPSNNYLVNRGELRVLELNQIQKQMSEEFISEISLSLPRMQYLEELIFNSPLKLNRIEDEELGIAILSLKNLKILSCFSLIVSSQNFIRNLRFLKALQKVKLNVSLSEMSVQVLMETFGELDDLENLILSIDLTVQYEEKKKIVPQHQIIQQQMKSQINLRKLKEYHFYIYYLQIINNEQKLPFQFGDLANLTYLDIDFSLNTEYQKKKRLNLNFLQNCVNLRKLVVESYDNSLNYPLKGNLRHLANLEKLEVRSEYEHADYELVEIFEGIQYLSKLIKLFLSVKSKKTKDQSQEYKERIRQCFKGLTNLRKLKIKDDRRNPDSDYYYESYNNIPLLLGGIQELRNLQKISISDRDTYLSDVDKQLLLNSLWNNKDLEKIKIELNCFAIPTPAFDDFQKGYIHLKRLKQLSLVFNNNNSLQNSVISSIFLSANQLNTLMLCQNIRYKCIDFDGYGRKETYLDFQNDSDYTDSSINFELTNDDNTDCQKGILNKSNDMLTLIDLDLKYSEEENNDEVINKIIKNINNQSFLQNLSLKLVSSKSRAESQLPNLDINVNFSQLNKLKVLSLFLNNLWVSEELQTQIKDQFNFSENLESLELILGKNINFSCQLFEALRNCSNLLTLKIGSVLDSKDDTVLGESVKYLKQLKSLHISFLLKYSNRDIPCCSSLVEGIASLANLNSLRLHLKSMETMQSKQFMYLGKMFQNKAKLTELIIDESIDMEESNELSQSIFNQLLFMPCLDQLDINLSNNNFITQEELNNLFFALQNCANLKVVNLQCSFQGQKIRFLERKYYAYQEIEPQYQHTIFVYDRFINTNYNDLKLEITLNPQDLKEITFDFLKNEPNIFPYISSEYSYGIGLLEQVYKNLEQLASQQINLRIRNVQQLRLLAEKLPHLYKIQNLTISVDYPEFDENNLLKLVEHIDKLKQIHCFQLRYSCWSQKDHDSRNIRNFVIKRTQGLVEFKNWW